MSAPCRVVVPLLLALAGGVTAADVAALDMLRRGQNARTASDDAHRERERKQHELAAKAAQGTP